MGGLGSKEVVSSDHKGLVNSLGDNTCFLNVVIQALWHVTAFRERLHALNYTHVHKTTPCVFCSLLHVFTYYKFSSAHIIPPTELRKALSDIYHSKSKFQLGSMGDAEECFDAVLKWLHCDQLGSMGDAEECFDAVLKWLHCDQVGLVSVEKYQEVGCSPPCISHACFGTEICDIRVCTRCKATSEPLPISVESFVYRFYVAEFLDTRKTTFSHRLYQMYNAQRYTCPEDGMRAPGERCPAKSAIVERWCLNIPEIFVISLVWPPNVNHESLRNVLKGLEENIDATLFFSLHEGQQSTKFRIVGMVCYVGRHYLSFYWSHEFQCWLVFNDAKVKQVGSFDNVIKKCLAKDLQPTLLFYERASTDAAKKKLEATPALADTMRPALPLEEFRMSAEPKRREAKRDDGDAKASARPNRSQSVESPHVAKSSSLPSPPPPPKAPPKPASIQCAPVDGNSHASDGSMRSARTRSRSQDHSSLGSGSATSMRTPTFSGQHANPPATFSTADFNAAATNAFSPTPRSPPLGTPAPARIQHDAGSPAHPLQSGPLALPSTPRAAPSPAATVATSASSMSSTAFGSVGMPSPSSRNGASHRTQYINRARTHALHSHSNSSHADYSHASHSHSTHSPAHRSESHSSFSRRHQSPAGFRRSSSVPPSLFDDSVSSSASTSSSTDSSRRRKKRDSSEPRSNTHRHHHHKSQIQATQTAYHPLTQQPRSMSNRPENGTDSAAVGVGDVTPLGISPKKKLRRGSPDLEDDWVDLANEAIEPPLSSS